MTDENINLVTNFLVGTDNTIKHFEEVEKRAERLGRLTAKGIIDPAQASKGLDVIKKKYNDTGNALGNAFKYGERTAQRFDMRMLSILFAGMAMQRVFGGALNSIYNTWRKVNDTQDQFMYNTTGLNKATLELSASWEFLKFSLFDALNTDWFIGIIDGVINVINWFSNLPNYVKIAIDAVLITLAALGTGALIYGSIKLAWNSIFGIGGVLATSAAETAASVTSVQTAVGAAGVKGAAGTGLIGSLGGLSTIIPVVAAVTAAFALLYYEIKRSADETARINTAFNTPSYNRTPIQAYNTKYDGTIVPLDVQNKQAKDILAISGVTALGQSGLNQEAQGNALASNNVTINIDPSLHGIVSVSSVTGNR